MTKQDIKDNFLNTINKAEWLIERLDRCDYGFLSPPTPQESLDEDRRDLIDTFARELLDFLEDNHE